MTVVNSTSKKKDKKEKTRNPEVQDQNQQLQKKKEIPQPTHQPHKIDKKEITAPRPENPLIPQVHEIF